MATKIARSAIRQKKIRSEQVRNAQRRRRERLKAENLGFLQLILPETLRAKLMSSAEETGRTLQETALSILAASMHEPEPDVLKSRRRIQPEKTADTVPKTKNLSGSQKTYVNLHNLTQTATEQLETHNSADDIASHISSLHETPSIEHSEYDMSESNQNLRLDDKSPNQLELF